MAVITLLQKKLMLNRIVSFVKKRINNYQKRKVKIIEDKLIDNSHKKYFQIQIKRSLAKMDNDAKYRYKLVMSKLLPILGQVEKKNMSVVCVGCRNTKEINEFTRNGFGNVVGIDLFSNSKKVLIMDMHRMSFDSDSFDIVYSADNLEHSYNPQLAVDNMTRVIKKGGYVCITTPIQWRKINNRENIDLSESADCQDFQSKDEVFALFSKFKYKIICNENFESSGKNNLLAIIQILDK